jgi:hypothetical protein
MPKLNATETGKLMLLAFMLALVLSAVGCATGPLGLHGVDYIPAFDTPDAEGGGG